MGIIWLIWFEVIARHNFTENIFIYKLKLFSTILTATPLKLRCIGRSTVSILLTIMIPFLVLLPFVFSIGSKLKEVHLVKNEQGMVELDLPELTKEKEHVISDFYMFSTERHGGSYFLKVGE